MKSKGLRTAWFIIGLFGMVAPHAAMADGGSVQLREAKGPFLVTIFLSSEAVCGGPGDISVLVQSRKNSEVLLDADVGLALYSPPSSTTNRSEPFCGLSVAGAGLLDTLQPVNSRATHRQASNKLLYAAAVKFDVAGIWRLHATVSRGPDRASFDCPISIASTSANPPGLWAYLAFPPIAITAFALNQMLRRHSLEKLSRSPVNTHVSVNKTSNPDRVLEGLEPSR